MLPLNPKVPLKHPQTHTHSPAFPCQTRPVRGTVSQEKKIHIRSLARLPFLIQNRILMASWGILLHPLKPLRESSAWQLHRAFLLPKPHGEGSPLSAPRTAWLSSSMAATLGFKSWRGSSSITPFLTPHNRLHLPVVWFLLPFSAAIVSPGKRGSMTQKLPPSCSCRYRKPLWLHSITG